MPLPTTRTFADAAALTQSLADAVLACAATALAARGVFHFVLAGGSTPRALYSELARRAAGDPRWQLWYGDERCLPADHPERNSVMAEHSWLAASAIPTAQRRAMPAELGAAAGARAYCAALAEVPTFDLVLLGIGEDGHTASLFPGRDWTGAAALAVHDAPKPPPDRVSLSAPRLSDSRAVWFVATGAGKHDALARWAAGERLPVAAVVGREQTVLWADTAALGQAHSAKPESDSTGSDSTGSDSTGV